MKGAPADQRLKARLNRADLYRRMKNFPAAVADATAVANAPESKGLAERGNAYLTLALVNLQQADLRTAIASVRRHLDERITPAPRGAAEALAACKSAEQLTEVIRSLL